MRAFLKPPPRISFIAAVFGLNALLFIALRLAFFWRFAPPGVSLAHTHVLKALYLGAKFDGRLAALMVLPLLLLGWIPGINLARAGFGRRFWLGLLTLAESAVLLFYFIDFGSMSYVGSRVNSTLCQFMSVNPSISLKMVWQSYPVLPLAALLLLFALGFRLLLGFLARLLLDRRPARSAGRWKTAFLYAAFFFLLAAAVYGRVSRFQLRWSESFFGGSNFVSQLGLNPVLFFFDTLDVTPNNYDETALRRFYPRLAAYYGVDAPDPATLDFRRRGRLHRQVDGRPNVVFIVLETFAADKVGALGNKLDPSPNFDRLAREGTLFTNLYVPMENTSRSLFALLFGIPDVSVGRYSSWNPLVVEQHTIVNAFTGYDKLYFLGGSANWGNIRGVLANNIAGLEIHEEGSYRSPVHDVWGIQDADLFMEANEVLRRKGDKPFLAVIQTSGNHRPFRIPEDARGFRPREMDEKKVMEEGFYSLKEYNGFRYLDHCLGYYFDLARKENYFGRTVFVVLADHGTNGGAGDKRFGDLAFPSFHIPLVLYAPGMLPGGRRVDRLASSLDVMPTLAGLLGVPYVNQTLGRDLFEPGADRSDRVFTYTPFRNPPRLGLMEEDWYVNVDPDGAYALYLRDAPEPRDLKGEMPERAREMAETAEGMKEAARWLLYHNKRPAAAGAAQLPTR